VNYLLDTNVISELVTPKPDPSVVNWFNRTDEDQLFISVISLAEIRRGIELLATGRRRERLNAWSLNDLPARFDGRILPVDPAVAAAWGRVMAQGQAAGRSISTMDAFIAATALCYGLTLVTRNVSDFYATGITLLNPWLALKNG
jgi:predicted nucleic acid-binding protein